MLISVFLFTRNDDTGVFRKTESFVSVEFDKVTALKIEDGDKNVLDISKKDSKWVLPGKFGFVASTQKVTDFFDKIKGLKRSWPVGTTDVSASQFEVVENKFERRITIYTGEKIAAKIYFGSSPSFKKIHGRVDGEQNVYSIDFNAYEAPIKAKEWLNFKFLNLSQDKVESVQLKKSLPCQRRRQNEGSRS